MKLNRIHHIAIICSDYEKSKDFYIRILGLEPVGEVYRESRKSYKLDLAVNGLYQIELFSFEDPPERVSYPEAAGLRHLAFEVDDIEEAVEHLSREEVPTEEIREDPFTGKRYTFFPDPDGLPIELYESKARGKGSLMVHRKDSTTSS
ncbi:SMU1112c/YaeR family gloxylase I-like metalloprotein [Evansella vedderi]|uniref:SMU1112c/YaeR family gloxylase I-like metalloprotein n=1 Tax=Evansella vedderi TaxID=38282 RepID=UPI0027D7E0F5|nr:VOC family protein [Evansella vedderi]